jgi:hypothetical protein
MATPITRWDAGMSFSKLTTMGMLTVMSFGVVLVFFFQGNPFGGVNEAYPAELARREALTRCSTADPQFSRFVRADRDRCYRAYFGGSSRSWSDW